MNNVKKHALPYFGIFLLFIMFNRIVWKIGAEDGNLLITTVFSLIPTVCIATGHHFWMRRRKSARG